MINKVIKFLMEIPLFYKIVQMILGGQGHKQIKKYLKTNIPKTAKKILDQGCGTGEYALLFPKKYTGIDNNPKDIEDAKQIYKENFLVGDAAKLPFKEASFDCVFAVGLHHHLHETKAKKAIVESLRVTKKKGRVIIVDAMWPKNKFNFYGRFWRSIDRGRFVRSYQKTLSMLPKEVNYKYKIISGGGLDYITILIDK